jgi:hypothetical protein
MAFALAAFFSLISWSVYLRRKLLIIVAAWAAYSIGICIGRLTCELLWPELATKADQSAASECTMTNTKRIADGGVAFRQSGIARRADPLQKRR